MSSSKSNKDCFLPSNFTGGSSVHCLIIFNGTPLASKALPKLSPVNEAPSQLERSANASKGLADACTPLSPVLGSALSLRFSQSLKTRLRKEPSSAVLGSVPPSTLDLKSAQARSFTAHSVL